LWRNRTVDSQLFRCRFAIVASSLCNRCIIALQSRRNAAQSICSHFTKDSLSLHNRHAIVPRSFRNRSAIVPQSFRNRSAIVPQSFRNRSAIVPQSFLNRSAIAPQAFRNRSSIVPQSFRNRSAIVSQTKRGSISFNVFVSGCLEAARTSNLGPNPKIYLA
jgi:hypothetical protein